MHCYNCSAPLIGDSLSDEHILPQSIGGRLKSKALLCRKCNNTFGNTIDKSIETCYESLIALLALDRQRSEGLPVIKHLSTANGTLYNLINGRDPVEVKPPVTKSEEGYQINARDEEQFRTILKGFKKRFPKLDVEAVIQAATRETYYLGEPLHFNFKLGGEGMLRAVGKIALNYYIHSHGYSPDLNEIIQVIKGVAPLQKYIHQYPTPSTYVLAPNEVSHTIYLKGDPKRKILYGWVNLFCFSGFIVNLSDQYSGPYFEETFCYDVLQKQVQQKQISIDYEGQIAFVMKIADQAQLQNFNSTSQASLKNGINRILAIADDIQYRKGISEILVNALNSVVKERQATVFTEEVLNATIERFSTQVAPFIANHLSKRQRGQSSQA